MWSWPRLCGLHKRISALEAWRLQHEKDIGAGGAVRRVEELALVMKLVRELVPRMAEYELSLNQAIQTNNNNLNRLLQALADVENSIRKDTRPIAAALERLNQRVMQLEWKVNAE